MGSYLWDEDRSASLLGNQCWPSPNRRRSAHRSFWRISDFVTSCDLHENSHEHSTYYHYTQAPHDAHDIQNMATFRRTSLLSPFTTLNPNRNYASHCSPLFPTERENWESSTTIAQARKQDQGESKRTKTERRKERAKTKENWKRIPHKKRHRHQTR